MKNIDVSELFLFKVVINKPFIFSQRDFAFFYIFPLRTVARMFFNFSFTETLSQLLLPFLLLTQALIPMVFRLQSASEELVLYSLSTTNSGTFLGQAVAQL